MWTFDLTLWSHGQLFWARDKSAGIWRPTSLFVIIALKSTILESQIHSPKHITKWFWSSAFFYHLFWVAKWYKTDFSSSWNRSSWWTVRSKYYVLRKRKHTNHVVVCWFKRFSYGLHASVSDWWLMISDFSSTYRRSVISMFSLRFSCQIQWWVSSKVLYWIKFLSARGILAINFTLQDQTNEEYLHTNSFKKTVCIGLVEHLVCWTLSSRTHLTNSWLLLVK